MLDDNDIKKLKIILLTKEQFLEVGVTKEDLKEFVTKKDFDDFKGKSLSKLDKILEGITPLEQEKTMKDLQDKNQKKVLEIHNSALKKNKILTEQEVSEINELRVF